MVEAIVAAMVLCLFTSLVAAGFLIRSVRAKRAEASYAWPGQANKSRPAKADLSPVSSVDLQPSEESTTEEPPRERRRSLASLRAELNENP